jgi:hypothetical protein
VGAQTAAIGQMKSNETAFDPETIFRAQYERVASIIARVVRDPARAEELAVEVFLKLERNPQAQGKILKAGCIGWGYAWDWMNSDARRDGLDMKVFLDINRLRSRPKRFGRRGKSEREFD